LQFYQIIQAINRSKTFVVRVKKIYGNPDSLAALVHKSTKFILLMASLVLLGFLFHTHQFLNGINNAQYEPIQEQSSPTINDPELKVETVFEGLNFPTSMEFIGADDILITEKNNGTVQRVINGTIASEPLLDINVATRAERGLLGIAASSGSGSDNSAVDKNLPSHVYLFFTRFGEQNDSGGERGEDSLGNSLIRYVLDGSKLVMPKVIKDWSPAKGPAHNGGAILIGPNNTLFIPVGDGDGHATQAQNIEDGPPPDGTGGILTIPLISTPDSTNETESNISYYAYGIRNSFGIDFDPVSGKLWDTENGLNDNDEINMIELGFNSGWSKIQGMAPIDFNYSLVNLENESKYSDPEFTWSETVGPTKIKFLNTDKLGEEYHNDIFVSDIKYGRVYHFDLNENRDQLVLSNELSDRVANTDEETKSIIFGSGFGGVTDMDVGPDGYLYILSFGKGTIYRIVPQTSSSVLIPSNNSFSIDNVGFDIVLPDEWRGVDNENNAIFSPNGISPRTGAFRDVEEKVMMTIEVINMSSLSGGLKQYLEDYKQGNCTILSNNFVQINNTTSQELLKQCGTEAQGKVLNHIYASKNAVVIVSLKGTGVAFDDNLSKFKDSISTIRMDDAADIMQLT
jgi:aldose sugar dehydrogenase